MNYEWRQKNHELRMKSKITNYACLPVGWNYELRDYKKIAKLSRKGKTITNYGYTIFIYKDKLFWKHYYY